MDWVASILESLTLYNILFGVGLFILSTVISLLVIGLVMVKIPANYFSSHFQADFMPGSPWLVRWGAVILKNLLGIFLVILGILLSLPGIPGQGVLTILLGLIMLDIPGKRPLESRIIKRPSVLNAVNRFRARFGKPPLIID